MALFTRANFKSLQKELNKYKVDGSSNIETDYIKTVEEAIAYVMSDMDETEHMDFTWPVPATGAEGVIKLLQRWKDRTMEKAKGKGKGKETEKDKENISFPGPSSAGSKRPAQASSPESEPASKRPRRSSNLLVDFHTNHLLDLLKDKEDVRDNVLMLQSAIRIVNAGADVKVLEWHLERLKTVLPDEAEISLAAALLVECIRYQDV